MARRGGRGSFSLAWRVPGMNVTLRVEVHVCVAGVPEEPDVLLI
jgi:hypothetical protein